MKTYKTRATSPELYKVEKNVQPPGYVRGAAKFPLAQMKVGDSFLANPKDRNAIHSTVNYLKKGRKLPKKSSFITRTDEKNPSLIRCWRIH